MLCEIEGFMNGQQFKKLYEKKCEPLMKKYNLRKIELDILYFLSTYRAYNTAKDIANNKCFSKAHISKAIENLTNKKYLMTSLDQTDRRCMQLSLTEEAEAVIQEIDVVWKQINDIIYQDIKANEQQQFEQIMNRILTNINMVMDNEFSG